MKKLIVLLLALGLVIGGGQPAQAGSPVKTQVIDVILDDDPTSITGTRKTANWERVGFYVDYDETDSGSAISVAITAEVSHDGTNFITASWFDFAGGSTLQTTETLSTDASYVGWFDFNMQIPFVKLTITATGSSATELGDVDGFIVGLR
jgi:hypothetical protein